MIQEYRCNKKSIIFNLIGLFVLYIILMVFLFRDGFRASIMPLIISSAGFYTYCILVLIKEWKVRVTVTDRGISYFHPSTKLTFDWNDITMVNCNGVKGVSCLESVILQSGSNRIILNSNIKGYQKLTEIVVNQVAVTNAKIFIHPYLKNKYLKTEQ